jgi:hypothetical protein
MLLDCDRLEYPACGVLRGISVLTSYIKRHCALDVVTTNRARRIFNKKKRKCCLVRRLGRVAMLFLGIGGPG